MCKLGISRQLEVQSEHVGNLRIAISCTMWAICILAFIAQGNNSQIAIIPRLDGKCSIWGSTVCRSSRFPDCSLHIHKSLCDSVVSATSDVTEFVFCVHSRHGSWRVRTYTSLVQHTLCDFVSLVSKECDQTSLLSTAKIHWNFRLVIKHHCSHLVCGTYYWWKITSQKGTCITRQIIWQNLTTYQFSTNGNI